MKFDCTRTYRFLLGVIGFAFLLASPVSAQLVVDRANGAMSLVGPEGSPLELNGYSVTSENGLLDPEAWNSLMEQEMEGWYEANPRGQMLSELNPYGFTDLAGSSVSLGSAYAGTTASLGDEDLTLLYSLADGTVVQGDVTYTGPINDLVLRVDPASGASSIELLSSNVGPFDVTGYSILSDSGSLVPANLEGLGESWTPASPTPTAVAELNLTESMVFTTSTTASIGNIFDPGGTQDLRFEYSTLGGEVLTGSVSYEAIGTLPGDCNGDGAVDAGDLACVSTIAERDIVLAAIPTLAGDFDGDGMVAFPDFLTLSASFNTMVTSYTEGDANLNGTVDFPDFLELSANFGQTPAAGALAAVPEPSLGVLSMIGFAFLGLVGPMRRRGRAIHASALGLLVLAACSSSAFGQVEFDTRMIVLDAANPGTNATIDTAREARGILYGTVTDVNIAEDVTGTVDLIDFAGDPGTYPVDNPYPNGVNDNTLVDFTVQVTGFLEIPAGDWTIGFNSDDGGLISMPRVEFTTTGGENGATGTPGELIFNGTRGFAWTYGQFTVPDGETLRTEFEAIFFERGGGDGLEVGHVDGFEDGTGLADFGFEVGDDAFGWTVLETGPEPGDFNWDDTVDFADFLVLANNLGTGSSFAQGDMNGDFRVDLYDFAEFFPLLPPEQGATAAASVPEPSGLSLLGLACASLLAAARRSRRRAILS